MDPEVPIEPLVLSATSRAEDLGFVALADAAEIMSARPELDYRLIGGYMFSLHVQRWALGPDLYRETADTDIGIPPIVAKDGWLLDQLAARGYEPTAGNRFERAVDVRVAGSERPTAGNGSLQTSAIDILIPAYTSRARENVRVTEGLTTTEVRGLALALIRPALQSDLVLTRLNEEVLRVRIQLPDEVSMLALKAFATTVRTKDSDVVDVWRVLEVCQAAGIDPTHFSTHPELEARAIVHRLFAVRGGDGFRRLARAKGMSVQGRALIETRILALVQSVLGR